jgi:hypothetical protein
MLAHSPTQPIAIDGARDRLAPDHVTDAARILRGGCGDQLQKVRVEPNAGLEQRFERASAAQAVARAAMPQARCNGRQTDRRARPFARRADRTLRPPTVFIRARNPCVRARRNFEGW